MRVLLVHGFASSVELSWGRTGWLDVLADAGHEVTAPDLLGHGNADKPHDPAAYTTGVEDGIRSVIPEPPVAAIGFSMGAQALLRIEADTPGTFERLLVAGIGANLFVPADQRQPDMVADAILGRREATDPLTRAFRQSAVTPPNEPEAMAACLRRGAAPITEEDLAKVACPVLVVVGDADPVAVPADRLVGALPDARLVTLKGADHLGTMKSFEFLDAALEFLG